MERENEYEREKIGEMRKIKELKNERMVVGSFENEVEKEYKEER